MTKDNQPKYETYTLFSPDELPDMPCVYFIRQGDAIKIGFSENVPRRLAGLQSSHYEPLVLLGAIPAAIDAEQIILERFKHLRIRGEWFRAEPELLDFIKAPTDLPPPPPQPSNAMILADKWMKWANAQSFECAAMSYAVTYVGFWLNMLKNGETPERVAGLREAMIRLDNVKSNLAAG